MRFPVCVIVSTDNFKEMEKYWDCSGVKTFGASHYEPPPPLTLRLSETLLCYYGTIAL